jgi:hypothetical protein
MSRMIQIEVNASLEDSGLIHRILNFKEDLYRDCLREGTATIADTGAVDRALDPLTIEVSSKRTLASVSKSIERALLRHQVAGNVKVQRENESTTCMTVAMSRATTL